ncbi:MAG: hypothetical protein KJ804_14615 [Proteobacteria bacterium]|nr:hypothetical protein [Pseudomonadota bacterium]MBU1059542.1 hypothetical protein [Pseudomonadota bacterium]
MNQTQVAEESLEDRNWDATTKLWKRLVEMGLSLIRVKSCNKVPNEGRGWQQIEHRSYDTIGFTPGDNAGVITDKRSGIIVLDVDDQAAFIRA